jgi:transposase
MRGLVSMPAHAAAIDVSTGEVLRARFGPGVEEPVAWLAGLRGPVRACYEAGPTGFGLYRAASAAGVAVEVIAPGKTPRGPSDRVKTDRKDAELLARLLLAGSLTSVVVPPVEVEAARELMRAHDACRRDLMSARHRVSKMLLRHGRVYPEPYADTEPGAPLSRPPQTPAQRTRSNTPT